MLRFVAAYGFRNIQNLVRKLKSPSVGGGGGGGRGGARRPGIGARGGGAGAARGGPGSSTSTAAGVLHFVEVMACPSGCTNGGGQLRAPTPTTTTTDTPGSEGDKGLLATKEWIQQVDRAYHQGHGPPQPPHEHAAVLALYQEWLGVAWNADVPAGMEEGSESTALRSRHLHTQYHAPTKNLASPMLSKW